LLKLKFALLAMLMGPMAFAGGPEKVSGQMVLDEVADALRRYRREKDESKRIRWLVALAPTRDPRVAVALGEALPAAAGESPDAVFRATITYYGADDSIGGVYSWWAKNKADLHRRARALP
jgi:hypothetical protein